MMKFCMCFHKIAELWNLFSLAQGEIFFRCYFRQLFMYLALRKCKKNDCKILKILHLFPQNHWTLKFIFSRSRGNFFRCYFRQLFMYLALRKCKKKMTVKYLKLVWYRFLSYKLEIARLSMGFRLNHFNVESDSSSFRRYKFSTSSFLITSRLSWKLFCPLESLSDDTAHAPYGALRHGERKHIFRNKKNVPFWTRAIRVFFFSRRARSRETRKNRDGNGGNKKYL